MGERKMNIKDIARIAKVGASTVSRVLNNHPDVSDETREKVWQVIKENNYIPNNSARVLKQTNTRNIGVLVKGVFNPFFSEILKIISGGVEAAGYTMILQHHNNESDIDTLLGFIKEKRLQGVICLGGNFLELDDEHLENVEAAIVLVSVDLVRIKNLKKCSSISINNKKAAYETIKYLIDNGHDHIGLVLGDKKDTGVGKERFEGYISALEMHDIEFRNQYIIYGQYDSETAYKHTMELLEKQKDITAIFCTSDIMAIGVAKAIFDSGYKLGEDISLIGFDGMDVAKYYEPSIATVKQPKYEMSNLSIELLLKLLNRETKNQHITLPVELVQGGSCSPNKRKEL